MLVGQASVSIIDGAPPVDKKPQPEIFSEKPKPSKCIDKIQVQQRSMVAELKKIKSLLKKKKD
jgi:hypothetical protein